MPNQQFFSLQACRQQAVERREVYANSTLHLFRSVLTVTGSTTKDQLEAAEADYDAYTSEALAAWEPPILAPGSGYMIGSPKVQFDVGATDPTVPNVIGGWWLQDSLGNVRAIGTFDPPLPMQVAGQGIPIALYDVFPTGFTGV